MPKPIEITWRVRSRGEEPEQQGRSFDYLHVALPVSKILEYRRRCDDIFKTYDIRVTEYAIWTAPELFSMLLVSGVTTLDQRISPRQLIRCLMLAQDMGGVMEYCHGVGIKFSHLLPREMGVGQDVVRAIKGVT